MGFGETVSFASAATARPGIVFRPIEDENASAAVEAIWPKGDSNPIRHRLLSYVRKHVAKPQRPAILPDP